MDVVNKQKPAPRGRHIVAVIIDNRQNKTRMNGEIEDEVLFASDNASSGVTKFKMELSSQNADVLLAELTDASSDKFAYAVREAFSNAYDATMCSGDIDAPIKVEIISFVGGTNIGFGDGTIINKIIRKQFASDGFYGACAIEDHGTGMTPDDVRMYFCQYGSSKKDGRTTIGSKGLGAKAPLACAPFFDVETRRDGKLTKCHVVRESGGNFGSMTISDCDPSEHGTRVVIPISDEAGSKSMMDTAQFLYDYTLDAHVIYNGQDNRRNGNIITDRYTEFGDVEVGVDSDGNPVSFKVLMHKRDELDGLFTYMREDSPIGIVIGGALYPFTMKDGRGIYASPVSLVFSPFSGYNRYRYIVIGKPGFLNFTLSRDEIKRDEHYKRLSEGIVAAMNDYDRTDAFKRIVAGEDGFTRLTKFATSANKEVYVELFDGNVCVKNGQDKFSLDIRRGDVILDGHDIIDILNAYITKSNVCGVIARNTAQQYTICTSGYKSRSMLRGECFKKIADKFTTNAPEHVLVPGDDNYALNQAQCAMTLVDASSNKGYYACVVTGCDGRLKDIQNKLSGFIAAKGGDKYKSAMIGMVKADSLSDDAKWMLDQSGVEVITVDDFLKVVRKHMSEMRKQREAEPKKDIALGMRTFTKLTLTEFAKETLANGERLDAVRFALMGNRNNYSYDRRSRSEERFQYYARSGTDYANLDTEDMNGTYIAVGRLCENAYTSGYAPKSAMFALLACAECGTVDMSEFTRLLVIDKMTSTELNALVERGAKVLFDVRTGIKNHIRSVVDDTDGVEVGIETDSGYGGEKHIIVTVDANHLKQRNAALVMSGCYRMDSASEFENGIKNAMKFATAYRRTFPDGGEPCVSDMVDGAMWISRFIDADTYISSDVLAFRSTNVIKFVDGASGAANDSKSGAFSDMCNRFEKSGCCGVYDALAAEGERSGTTALSRACAVFMEEAVRAAIEDAKFGTMEQ